MHTNNEKPGAYTGFFKKKNNGLQTAVRGGSEGTLIPQWAPAERGGSPKRLPTGTKKVPYIETKVAKRPPHSEKVAKRPPIIAKKDFPG